MALMGAIACAILVAFGPALFEFVFGAGWREAGYFAGWMSLWMMFLLAAVPAQSIFVIKGRLKLLLVLEIAYLIPRIAVIPMGALDDDPGRHADDHIFVGSAAPWYTIADALPRFEEGATR